MYIHHIRGGRKIKVRKNGDYFLHAEYSERVYALNYRNFKQFDQCAPLLGKYM